MALSDSRPTRRLCGVGAASPRRDGSPPLTRITLPTCRAPYPGGSRRVPASITSPLTWPSPFPRRVGIRIFTFEASSSFTRVTARWIAQPPTAAFVTRLRPGRLPCQAARQLPDQSTTLWMEPSSTGDTRRRGALGNPGLKAGLIEEHAFYRALANEVGLPFLDGDFDLAATTQFPENITMGVAPLGPNDANARLALAP